MSVSPLLPQAFWFRLAIPCRRIEAIPRSRGKLPDLPVGCVLPRPASLSGKPVWAEVRAGWNPEGLGLSFEVSGKLSALAYDPLQPELSDRVEIWLDTRDTRNVHRATRFCQRFNAELIPDDKGAAVAVKVVQRPIHRALVDAPRIDPALISARAETIRKGWRLELFFPAAALNGFDPETNRRLGFYYQVTESERGDQFLAVGRDFPIGEDPSLWATLELLDR